MKPILLVDDDIIFLDLLAASLKRKGFAVIKASSVAEAKNILKEHTPLLICSDLVMPKESGFDLLDFIHNRFPNIPFIVMSAHDKEVFLMKQFVSALFMQFQNVKLDCLKRIL